ncbi:poly(A) polymerase i [Phtheirospermum japonicum]|uniref:Poly(A) polymerase i n=1 Tax=Phtheirospermum japonicum TaxID=374723 RepID=A0A830D5C8_9LAMI|nr:poly(A) polymerase i [Phtheirospermum japonicum]
MALSHPLKGKTLLSRLKPFLELERYKGSLIEDGGRIQFSSNTGACSGSGQVESSKWRKLDSRNLGITRSMIPVPSWMVLKNLRDAGFDAYLVGGCVRDLLLNKVPKDFDVITTAKLKQVKKKFQRAIIVGQRFPICRVIIKGSLVEVSSFDTVAGKSMRKQVGSSQMPTGCDPRDFVRWKNCMNRDFTVNSLFFDPFLNTIFDYTNGMMDLKSLKLRTVMPAHSSFLEDQARILRGLRLAARLNLSFSKETEAAIYSLSSSVAELSTSRLTLEMNYMLSYGAAESSLVLLKRFKLLEILLPFHAAYLSEQVDNRLGLRSLMLMGPDYKVDLVHDIIYRAHPDLCPTLPTFLHLFRVAILAFHMALFSNPQPAVVVLTFASLLYHQTWEESIEFARRSALATQVYVPEILDAHRYLSDDEIAERVTQFAGQVVNTVNVLINKDCLFEAMARFPEIPCSGLVSKEGFTLLYFGYTSLMDLVKHKVVINPSPYSIAFFSMYWIA